MSTFIEISSKHTKEEYYDWITYLLKYKGPIVLFIDMDLNEFNTPYFLWLDMGYLRCGATFPDDWPNLDKLRIMDDKIVIMSLMNKNCLREDKPRKYTYSDPPHGVMVTGGIMGSHTKNINRFHTIFYQKLEDIINQTNEWAGMEQFILSHIYCENQPLFYNIKAKRHKLVKNNPWFYGIPYFAS